MKERCGLKEWLGSYFGNLLRLDEIKAEKEAERIRLREEEEAAKKEEKEKRLFEEWKNSKPDDVSPEEAVCTFPMPKGEGTFESEELLSYGPEKGFPAEIEVKDTGKGYKAEFYFPFSEADSPEAVGEGSTIEEAVGMLEEDCPAILRFKA